MTTMDNWIPKEQPARAGIMPMTATEVQRLREEVEASAFCGIDTAFPFDQSFRWDADGFAEAMRKQMIHTVMLALHSAVIVRTELVGEWHEPVGEPVKPHPLQKLADQPNGWGQSMWRPWE